jgi:hypothetical protein
MAQSPTSTSSSAPTLGISARFRPAPLPDLSIDTIAEVLAVAPTVNPAPPGCPSLSRHGR